jgi:predicted nicotinamide N-methyase
MPVTPEEFIRQHTRLQSPPLVPELELHIADNLMRLWEKMGDDMGHDNPSIPFWGSAWVGGQALARYLLDNPAEASGKTVLDIATGSGLCAIAALKAGAARVAAVDVDPLAVAAARINAETNQAGIEVVRADILARPAPETDLLLAGDVMYEEDMAKRMLPWLESAHRRGIRVLMGDPGRHYFPREIMAPLAAYDVPTTWEVEGVETKRTGVYTFS